MDKAYASWARLAELELASVTGHSVPLGRRAAKPSLVRRTFRNRGPGRAWASVGEARGLGWVMGMAQELEALSLGRADLPKVKNRCTCILHNPPPWLSDLGQVGVWLRWLQGLAAEAEKGQEVLVGFHGDLAQLDHELGLARSCDLSSRAKQWSDWAKSSLEGSAGKAHKFTRVPEAWVPIVARGLRKWRAICSPCGPLAGAEDDMGEALAGVQRGRHQGQLYLAHRCPLPSSPHPAGERAEESIAVFFP